MAIKTSGIVAKETRVAAAQALLLKGPCMDLLAEGFTHSELQSSGSSSKGTRDKRRANEFSDFRRQVATISRSSSTWLIHFVPCPGTSKPFPVAFPYKWLALAHVVDFPKISQRLTKPKQATSVFQHVLYLWLNSPKPSTNTARLIHSFLGTSKPSTGGGHLQIILRLMSGGFWERQRLQTEVGLQWVLSQESLGLACPVDSFGHSQSITGLAPRMTHPKGRMGRHQNPAKVNPAL
ncbi:hypothetical protein mRhiFer1_008127 [Rhinolophus ferrumequinum]|uniref:Uncharacterized protein n=1 Tax=Rhinolophus ferrumequinum TaxID=59479 RepID=A0A7J7W7C4_RHIFE|nr:hypothetical protein mRhiFer1_008127 [Rhinolophus ferrumequinum]